MGPESELYIPCDEILRELGLLQIRHTHLDHTLRLAIKRMLGISIDDPGYWNESRGMTAALRNRARELIAERHHDDYDTSDVLTQLLDSAEELTKLRNRALHSVWMKACCEAPVLHDRDNWLRKHVTFQPPSIEDLQSVSSRIEQCQRVLDDLTRAPR